MSPYIRYHVDLCAAVFTRCPAQPAKHVASTGLQRYTTRIDSVSKDTVERCLAGYRSAKAMARAIRSLLSDEHIYKMKEGETLEQASSGKHPIRVVLFTEKMESTWLYKSLSWKYHDSASFFEIPSRTNHELIEAYNIQQFPSLLVLKVFAFFAFCTTATDLRCRERLFCVILTL